LLWFIFPGMKPSEPRQIGSDLRHPVNFLELFQTATRMPGGSAKCSAVLSFGLPTAVLLNKSDYASRWFCIVFVRTLSGVNRPTGSCTRQAVEHLVADFLLHLRLGMNTAIGSIKAKREIAWRINGWHTQVELHRAACSEAVYSSLDVAW